MLTRKTSSTEVAPSKHNHYPFNVVTKQDQRIIDIISNPEKSREEIQNMSDKDLTDLLAIAGSKYKDNLVKLIFEIKKENISDYLIMYLLENSYDMNKMIRYFVQFIPKERLNNIINKTRLKISKIEESLRASIRKILNEAGDEIDSCWGYIGDYDEKGGMLEEVKGNIDRMTHDGTTDINGQQLLPFAVAI